jgi:hypothetical protein
MSDLEHNAAFVHKEDVTEQLVVNSNTVPLKVHKNENFFGFDFEFCTISLLVMSKY